MIELTEDQRQELDTKYPARVLDPQTKREYVLVQAEVYDRLRGLLADGPEAMYPLLAELEPEDWEDASAYGIACREP